MASGISRVLLATLSVVVATGIVEIGLHAINRYPPPAPPRPRFPALYRAHERLGYTLKPSTETTYVYPTSSTRSLPLVSNADGFRSRREFDEPDTRPRIWVLGDSMVLGEGVAAEDRFSDVVERLEPGWRVDNVGMTGWGVDLMVRTVEYLLPRVRPDVVVLCVYTDDFRRLQPWYAGQGYPIPKFEFEGGVLVSRSYPPPPPLWRRMRVTQAIEQNLTDRDRLDLHAALLQRLQRMSDRTFTLAVVFLPGTVDTPRDLRRRTWLRAWCVQAGLMFSDLTDVIHKAGVSPLFLPNNSHWNEQGHRLAGEAVHAFLRRIVQDR